MQLTANASIHTIIDNSYDMLCVFNSNMQFVSVSKAMQNLLGYAEKELIGAFFTNFVCPQDVEPAAKSFSSIMGGANNINFDIRNVCKNGSFIPLSWSATWLPGDQLMFCVVREKKVKKGTGESLGESKENYKLLFYSNPFPIIIYDVESLAILDVNQMTCKLYGYSVKELTGLTIKDIHATKDEVLTKAMVNAEFNEEIKKLGTWDHLKNNGDTIKVEVTGHSVQYMGRHCMMVVCKDITEESKTLRSLEKSIERFEYVTEATTDIIWDWDLEANEVYYSRNIKKSFGHTPGVNVGDMRFFAQYVHPEDRERVVLYPDPVKYGTMNYWTEKYRFRKANGEYAFVLDKGVVIRDEKGIGIRMIGAMQDITELKNSELQIAKQNAQLIDHAGKLNTLNMLKDRLIAILAHDLRGPLSSLRGLFELFQDDTISNVELLEMIPDVVKKLDYTSDFLDTLLFWVNTQMENFEKAIKEFSVKDIVIKEKQNLHDQAVKKGINLKIDMPDNMIAFADPDSVRIVIRNLAMNAIKFSNEKDIIEVSAKQDGRHVLIRVKDTGIGMTPEQSAKLFNGKVDSKRGTNNELGTGMGLLFCKDLIEKCNGKIWVTSTQGVGTEFSFTIPVAMASV
jgi:PAS domain S-box-containing protein